MRASAMWLLAAFVVGCTSTSDAVIEFADPDLSGVVEFGAPAIERLQETNNLKVTVPIRNVTDEQVQLLVQMEFRDANKLPYGDVTPSRVMVIPRGMTKNFSATSLKPLAMDYRMRLRWNR